MTARSASPPSASPDARTLTLAGDAAICGGKAVAAARRRYEHAGVVLTFDPWP